MATTVKLTKMLPSSINERSSFVSYVPAREIESVIVQTGAVKQTEDAAPAVNNWPTLLDAATTGPLKPKR